MFNYTGQKCPYCEEIFKNGDDIAVCPECGTPHHRACYLEHKRCANSELHAAGFEWKPENTAASADGSPVVCPRCGNENPPLSLFCNNCAYELSRTANDPQDMQGAPVYGQNEVDSTFSSKMGQEQMGQMPMYGQGGFLDAQSRQEDQSSNYAKETIEEIDGIKTADWVSYIGVSIPYYLANFKFQDTYKRKTSFTWSAAVVPYAYFAYRKMWWQSAVSVLVSLLLALPSAVIMLIEMNYITASLTISQLNTLSLVSSVCSFVYLLYRLLCGLFAVYLYRKDAGKKIRKLKAASPTGEIAQQGPSMTGVLVVVVCFFAVALGISWLLLRTVPFVSFKI